MNAIRKDDEVDYKHSLYVDQWDWELIINKDDRNLEFLKRIVETIYKSIRYVENKINFKYPVLDQKLPSEIKFINSKELYREFPNVSPEERENIVAKKYKAVFIYKIGHTLPDGLPSFKKSVWLWWLGIKWWHGFLW